MIRSSYCHLVLATRNRSTTSQHPLAGQRLSAWHLDLHHDATEGESRLLVVADNEEGFGPGFDREVVGSFCEGRWVDAEGMTLGPVVAVSRAARRESDVAETVAAAPSPEALALGAQLHGLKTMVACMAGLVLGFSQ